MAAVIWWKAAPKSTFPQTAAESQQEIAETAASKQVIVGAAVSEQEIVNAPWPVLGMDFANGRGWMGA